VPFRNEPVGSARTRKQPRVFMKTTGTQVDTTMIARDRRMSTRRAPAHALCLVIGLIAAALARDVATQERLLFAPMLHGTDLCEAVGKPEGLSYKESTDRCARLEQTAAPLIESSLSVMGPAASNNGRYELGYTLKVPLLDLYMQSGADWILDARKIRRITATIRQTRRPVVLYIYSNHFEVRAPIEKWLATDATNFAHSVQGPMPVDTYLEYRVYPWTFADLNASITRYRERALDAVVSEVCRLRDSDLRKVRGMTLLGEVHHYYPDFQKAMGFDAPYLISDYSPASVAGFRAFLKSRFGSIDSLNRALGSDFVSFDAVSPPSKDIRKQRLERFVEHIDPFAHGVLPVFGWAHDARRTPLWIRIYRNGELVARVPAALGRQDVLEAKPQFGTSNVGWRFDLPFAQLPAGIHQLDILAERRDGTLVSLATRRVSIMDRDQRTPQRLPLKPLPHTVPASDEVAAWVDHPPDAASFFFNPLALLWQEYRNWQVAKYIDHFAKRARHSCLKEKPIYSHQIAPFLNPTWDTTKFATDASLKGGAGAYRLGINLYGGAAYGDSFFDWLRASGNRSYAVPEFHPMRAMSLDEYRAMFERHRSNGAHFISFFGDISPEHLKAGPQYRNEFSVESTNPKHGSDIFFSALQRLMTERESADK